MAGGVGWGSYRNVVAVAVITVLCSLYPDPSFETLGEKHAWKERPTGL